MSNAVQLILDGLSYIFLIVGACFVLVGAVGILRFPDLLTRMHATTKAGTLGVGLIFVAIALHEGSFSLGALAAVGLIFIMMTAPISAHLLGRAAYLSGDVRAVRAEILHIDHLEGQYLSRNAAPEGVYSETEGAGLVVAKPHDSDSQKS